VKNFVKIVNFGAGFASKQSKVAPQSLKGNIRRSKKMSKEGGVA
jgi:hypothetical protein